MSKMVTYLIGRKRTIPDGTPFEYAFMDMKLDKRKSFYKWHKDHIVRDEDVGTIVKIFEDNGALFNVQHCIIMGAIIPDNESAQKVRKSLENLGYKY